MMVLQDIVAQAPRLFGAYNLLFLGRAMLTTFALSLLGCGCGLCAGLGLAVLRQAPGRAMAPLRLLSAGFVEAFRRIPFLVTLMLVFFGTQALRLDLDVFTVAVVSIFLIGAAYTAEIVRAGFNSVLPTQWQAAEGMNFGYLATLRLIVLPQALRSALPPASAYLVLLVKDTALASQIGVVELTQAAKTLASRGFPAELVYGMVLVLYFAISYPLARAGLWLERRHGAARYQ